ncbi:hypothetical protein E4U55_002551 [Claviceps digitariae]|nr:hypothetical protein E4U55_002551 [Claviceps digitariae]
MVPIAVVHDIVAADTSSLNSLAIEYPKLPRAEECDEKRDRTSSCLLRRIRKPSRESHRKRRPSDGASVMRVFGDERQDESGYDDNDDNDDNEDNEDETKEPMDIPEPIQTPPPSLTNNASLLRSSTSSASPTPRLSQPMGNMQQPPPPAAPAPLHLAKPVIPKTPSKVPLEPPRPADVVNPIELPPGNSLSQSSQTTVVASSTLSASRSQSTTSSTTIKWALPALTAMITLPIPALAADGIKEGEVLPTGAPIATGPNNPGFAVPPASPTNVLPMTGSNGSPGDDNNEQNDSPTGKTLIVVGSIGGVIILALLGWLVWRLFKRRRRGIANTRDQPPLPPFPTDTPSATRRRLVTKTLSRIPILKEHIDGTDSGWTNLDHPYVGSSNKTTAGAPAASSSSSSTGGAQQQPGLAPTIVVHTEIVRKSFHATQQQTREHARVPKQQAVSSTEAQHRNAPDPRTQPRKSCPSDNSSLSSGFGDGQFMMNNNNNYSNYNYHHNSNHMNSTYQTNNPAAVVTTINAPSFPATQRDSASIRSQRRRRRDTVCTEASEDWPPRFRTVNSWVKQQSSRVVRAKQRAESPSAPGAITPTVPKVPPE